MPDYISALHANLLPEDKSIATGLSYHFIEMFVSELQESTNSSECGPTDRDDNRSLLLRFAEVMNSDKYTTVLRKKIRRVEMP